MPLPVADAAYIEQHRPAGVPREPDPKRAALPAPATPQPAQPALQRVIVFLADDLNLSCENAHAVRHVLDMPIEKRGPHMVRAVVRDAATGRMGSAARFVMIPDPKQDRVVLSSVVLGGGREEQDRWLGLDTHRFRPGDTLEFAASLVKGDPARLKTTVRLSRERELFHEGALPFRNAESGIVVSGALRLRENISPGAYALQVAAEDRQGRQRGYAEQWAEFLIAP